MSAHGLSNSRSQLRTGNSSSGITAAEASWSGLSEARARVSATHGAT
jgi:hypothetical protein